MSFVSGTIAKALGLLQFMVLLCLSGMAQTPQWVVSAGGPNGSDYIRICRIAPGGNIYVAGRFTDTIDLDPSPDTHMLVSNGHARWWPPLGLRYRWSGQRQCLRSRHRLLW